VSTYFDRLIRLDDPTLIVRPLRRDVALADQLAVLSQPLTGSVRPACRKHAVRPRRLSLPQSSPDSGRQRGR